MRSTSFISGLVLMADLPVSYMADSQHPLSWTEPWKAELSKTWDVRNLVLCPAKLGYYVSLFKHSQVLGPFPINAREQHFLSPAFPLNCMLNLHPPLCIRLIESPALSISDCGFQCDLAFRLC